MITDEIQPLSDFFYAIRNDYRISTTHIGIFSALLIYQINQGANGTFKAFSKDIMILAKVSSPFTYLRCLKELHDYGYIVYKPSFKKTEASKICFLS